MQNTTTKSRGAHHAFTVTVDDVEPWSVTTLLHLLSEKAKKHGIEVYGNTTCAVRVSFEYHEHTGDATAFLKDLADQFICFEATEE